MFNQKQAHCLIITEVTQAHDGSLRMAHALIDAVENAGPRGAKVQTDIAPFESTPSKPWRIEFPPQDSTHYEYWSASNALMTSRPARDVICLSYNAYHQIYASPALERKITVLLYRGDYTLKKALRMYPLLRTFSWMAIYYLLVATKDQ